MLFYVRLLWPNIEWRFLTEKSTLGRKYSLSHHLLIYSKFLFHIQPAPHTTNTGQIKNTGKQESIVYKVPILDLDVLGSNLSPKIPVWMSESYLSSLWGSSLYNGNNNST